MTSPDQQQQRQVSSGSFTPADGGAAPPPPPRVLSMQSSVSFGHVGNAAAVFPMQYRGVDVSALHTLQFSSQPLYSCGKVGSKVPDEDISDILGKMAILNKESLEKSSGQRPLFTHILSGYIGDVPKVEALAKYVRSAKEMFPRTFFFCDPVCGDNGRLYVHESVPQAIKMHLLPLADAIKPNMFEVKIYTGIDIVDVESARKAALALHEMGPRIVIISSFSQKLQREENEPETPRPERGYAMLSRLRPRTEGADNGGNGAEEDESSTVLVQDFHTMHYPIVDGHYVGTGDTFSALVMSEIAMRGEDAIEEAVHRALQILYLLVRDTKQNAVQVGGQKELRLVAMRHLFDLPPSAYALPPPPPRQKDLDMVSSVVRGSSVVKR